SWWKSVRRVCSPRSADGGREERDRPEADQLPFGHPREIDLTQSQTTDLKRELLLLDELLGDTRVRFRQGKTHFASAQDLIDVDLEIRTALARPLSAELQLEVQRLLARLRALDPH